MMRSFHGLLIVALMLSAARSACALPIVHYHLGPANIVGNQALFDLSISYNSLDAGGAPDGALDGDTSTLSGIELWELDVNGPATSAALLTLIGPGNDLSRFSFTPGGDFAAIAGDWTPFAEFNPLFDPYFLSYGPAVLSFPVLPPLSAILEGASMFSLGTLAVNISGIPGETSLTLDLNGTFSQVLITDEIGGLFPDVLVAIVPTETGTLTADVVRFRTQLSAIVPEPATLTLLALAAAGLSRRRGRQF